MALRYANLLASTFSHSLIISSHKNILAFMYRDDGLAVVALDGPGVERLRKDVSKLFKDNGLKITVEANLKSTSFLDITIDLNSSSFGPFL